MSTSSRTKPSDDGTSTSSRTKPSDDGTSTSSRTKPSKDRTSTSSRTKPSEDGTSTSSRTKPSEDRTSTSSRTEQCAEGTTRFSGSAADLIGVVIESGPSPSENPLSLQSVQISTSTMEIPGGATLSVRGQSESGDMEGESGLGACAIQISDAGLDSDSNPDPGSGSAQSNLLTKVPLPPPLKKDLTRQVGLKTKISTHEPNLNIARRIRNVSGTRRGEVEKDSGLKPTLRQLISSSGSRRCVNWDQVYQEVHRKKKEQGKGMPRFGIEMVSYDQESQQQDLPLTEGFQWESFLDFENPQPAIAPVTPRKRSLSESSVAPDRSAANLSSLFGRQVMPEGPGEDGAKIRSSEQQGSKSSRKEPQPKVEGTHGEAERPVGALIQQKADSIMGDSSSGTEHNESLGTGKKRRAAGDVPSPEVPSSDVPSSERKNKRMKVKSKKERLQVDQLLTVSLREDELCRSLQGIDNSLIQARAALQAAYIEVQRLLVVKQQVSMEMSALRSKRIELLQGMQGGFEATPPDLRVKGCEEEMPLEDRPLTDDPPPCLDQATQRAVPLCFPPRATPPTLSPCHRAQPPVFSPGVVIKQEPLSPGATSREAERGSAECNVHLGGRHSPHSTTPEPTVALPHTESAPSNQSVFRGRRKLDRSSREPSQEESSMPPGESDESGSLGRGQQVEQGVQVTRADIWDCKPPLTPPPGPSSSRTELPDAETSPALPPPLPSPQGEVRAVKRVRKLKKKRLLKKAQGAELQPDNSDTELETETAPSRPNRRLRRRASGASPQVTTSTPPGAAAHGVEGSVDDPGHPASRPDDRQLNSDSSLEMVELADAPPVQVVSIDTSDESSMEVCSIAPPPNLLKPQKLACNEVTSTSGMELSTKVKTCPSAAPLTQMLNTQSKSSSDVSSELREEELPSEGLFEGHQEAVNAMQVHMGLLYTCSGDLTVRAFDLVSRQCVALFEGHSTKVNCLLVSSAPGLKHRLYSGSSDQTIRCYSLQTKECLEVFSLPDRVLCLHNRWKVLYAGLGNGSVVTFSLKTNKQLDVFECHGPRAVSCLATAQEGARRILLVGSYDTTISVRDAKSGLLLRTLEGHAKTVLCMNVANDLVFSGSSDQSVYAHNIHTGELVRVYNGHSHAVTVVAIVGKVMVTACLDKLVRVFELQSNDRLQVYGGHKDMVMCMVIHKSMIYTGCYDGSVQAVKLNLMQNYRCWWHGCSLIFGVFDHLQQHLVHDHTSNNTQTFKCRWKDCSQVLCCSQRLQAGGAKACAETRRRGASSGEDRLTSMVGECP
ncbi:hypothetical protein UPYG_G00228050 [Umbra pygmaea]|uniref:C2H2-type domain-containing protein n=1 Tax=Umbra pygmaea TaxID=75934 RepID=A0ABD0WCW7_UMBPY